MNEKEVWNNYIRYRTSVYEAMDPEHISRNLIIMLRAIPVIFP